MSRADTTLNSSRRYGERTCESKVSSSNISVASTTWWRSSPSSGPARGVGSAFSLTIWSRGRKRRASPRWCAADRAAPTLWSSGTPTSTFGRRSSHNELGWPHADQADIAAAWRRIRSQVRDWTDLEPALIGRVEELIDFVTQPAGDE
ncbi:Protein of uncharacterised function (DUF3097) [Mycobacterium tuberculosis]|nr:Protein of uncharacterised function (DUF3097) [Mycobacterium tuberculosis]